MLKKSFRKFNEVHFYLDSTSLLEFVMKSNIQLSKDMKVCFGNPLIIMLRDLLVDFRKAYEETDQQKKLNIVKNTLSIKLRDIETLFILMEASKVINICTFRNFIKYIGMLRKQLNGWANKIEKHIKNENID